MIFLLRKRVFGLSRNTHPFQSLIYGPNMFSFHLKIIVNLAGKLQEHCKECPSYQSPSYPFLYLKTTPKLNGLKLQPLYYVSWFPVLRIWAELSKVSSITCSVDRGHGTVHTASGWTDLESPT